mgnify:FL=1
MKVNVALFGLGRIGMMHAKNIHQHSKFKLKYIYDVNQKISLKASKKFNTKNIASPSFAFKDKSLDVIFIASSTVTHIPFIEDSVKYKKVVFCEKPLDLNIKKVIQCKKKIKKLNPKIQIGFNRRYDPGHFSLKKAIQKRRIGKVEKIIITSRDPAPPSFKYLKKSGGIFRDMTIHDFDLVRFYLGKDKIKEIFASASNISNKNFNKINDYELATCILKSKSGVISIINNSRHCSFGYDQRVEIFGDKGMLISQNKRRYNFFIDRYKSAYKLQLNDLFKLVKKNKASRASFDDGEKALVLANAAYKSLRGKKSVKIK